MNKVEQLIDDIEMGAGWATTDYLFNMAELAPYEFFEVSAALLKTGSLFEEELLTEEETYGSETPSNPMTVRRFNQLFEDYGEDHRYFVNSQFQACIIVIGQRPFKSYSDEALDFTMDAMDTVLEDGNFTQSGEQFKESIMSIRNDMALELTMRGFDPYERVGAILDEDNGYWEYH